VDALADSLSARDDPFDLFGQAVVRLLLVHRSDSIRD
jgi:hypothetical protein